tara:strand:- start:228 stop:554 length:327 start_codon:yes stop_codon:yes gene_type:complete
MSNKLGKGGFKKGKSGNPKGRPRSGKSNAELFRTNPKAEGILEQIFDIASTLGKGKKEHKDAMACAKLIADKMVPTLKSQELEVSGVDKGYVVIPEQKASKKENQGSK